MALDSDDILYMVQDIEKRFQTKFARNELNPVASAGQLLELLATKLQAQPFSNNPCPTARAFLRLQERLENAGFPTDLTPSTPTASLIPEPMRKRDWAAFSKRVNLSLPFPDFPAWLTAISSLVLVVFAVIPVTLAVHYEALAFVWLSLLSLPAALLLPALVHFFFSSIIRYRIPAHLDTLAGLAYHLALLEKESDPTPWTQPQLWAAIQYTLAQYTHINPRRIRRQTTFLALATMK